MLLVPPVVSGKAQDAAIQQKIDELDRDTKRLSQLHAHDSLVLLKNSLAMPKLLYLLRTADCSGNQLLEVFDSTLTAGLSKVLNVDLNDDQWLQASLPVREGGLGIRRLCRDASAFLASAMSTLAPFSPTASTRWKTSLCHLCPAGSALSTTTGLRLPIDWDAKPANRTTAHVAKQWIPVDFMVSAAEGAARSTSVIIR